MGEDQEPAEQTILPIYHGIREPHLSLGRFELYFRAKASIPSQACKSTPVSRVEQFQRIGKRELFHLRRTHLRKHKGEVL